jgi:hypothetical protein
MLVDGVKLFDNVITVRFAAYLALVTAVIASLWIAGRRPGLLRIVLPLLAVLALIPDPHADGFSATYAYEPFFTSARYSGCFRPGETVLVIPQPAQVVVQALDHFRYRLPGGYVGPGGLPKSYLDPPINYTFAVGTNPEGHFREFRKFLAAKHVTSLVVEEYDYNAFAPTFDRLAKPQHVGGVALYHLYTGAPSCPTS